jgi:hypothetical protein
VSSPNFEELQNAYEEQGMRVRGAAGLVDLLKNARYPNDDNLSGIREVLATLLNRNASRAEVENACTKAYEILVDR